MVGSWGPFLEEVLDSPVVILAQLNALREVTFRNQHRGQSCQSGNHMRIHQTPQLWESLSNCYPCPLSSGSLILAHCCLWA